MLSRDFAASHQTHHPNRPVASGRRHQLVAGIVLVIIVVKVVSLRATGNRLVEWER